MNTVTDIVLEITKNFRTFGGGATSFNNTISAALKDEPPQFAMGVDVEDVVAFVIEKYEEEVS